MLHHNTVPVSACLGSPPQCSTFSSIWRGGGGEEGGRRAGSENKTKLNSKCGSGQELMRHAPHTFGIMSGMNFCPPKPGSMVITRIMSTRETKGTTSSTGVPGLMPIPT